MDHRKEIYLGDESARFRFLCVARAAARVRKGLEISHDGHKGLFWCPKDCKRRASGKSCHIRDDRFLPRAGQQWPRAAGLRWKWGRRLRCSVAYRFRTCPVQSSVRLGSLCRSAQLMETKACYFGDRTQGPVTEIPARVQSLPGIKRLWQPWNAQTERLESLS
jgi:hypothetical protein